MGVHALTRMGQFSGRGAGKLRTHSQHARTSNRSAALVACLLLCLTASGCSFGMETDPVLAESITRQTSTDALGREISALRAGPQAPLARVVLVHGTPGRASHLAELMTGWPEPIATSVEFVSVDRPGFGSTLPDDADVTFEGQAAALTPFLRDGVPTILVGHSLGGPIVAWAATEPKARVGALVILAGSLSPELEKPRWFNHVGSWWITQPLMGRALRISNKEIMAAPEQTRLLDARLDRVTCPVFILHGTKDGLVPVENVAYMQRAFTNAESLNTRTLEGAGHLLPWRHEDVVRRSITEAIRAVAPELRGSHAEPSGENISADAWTTALWARVARKLS